MGERIALPQFRTWNPQRGVMGRLSGCDDRESVVEVPPGRTVPGFDEFAPAGFVTLAESELLVFPAASRNNTV